ncbi:acyltransferase family protein [Streptosporangium sp. NPDC050855]|uniref:acyltransferase family protein n=1 Tax=Streptosporangium sp. NPDC050855 TaxID=3366194 RepID=UPI0037A9619D
MGDLPAIGGHLDAMDGVRAVASFGVLLYHVASTTGASLREGFLPSLLSRGDIGVPIFFLLSGFLLYRPWARRTVRGTGADRVHGAHERAGDTGNPRDAGDAEDAVAAPDVGDYLWKRALRILPAYWLVVVVALTLWSWPQAADPWKWLPFVLLVQNYVPDPWWGGVSPPGLGQMWSLSVEMTFYLALPLIAAALHALARRGADPVARARLLLGGVCALGAVSPLWAAFSHYPVHRPELGLWLPRLLVYFAAGMALAVVSLWAHAEPDPDAPVRRLTRGIRESWVTCWIIAGLVYVVAASPIAGGRLFEMQDLWTDLFEMTLYTVFVLALLSPVALQPPGPSPIRSLLGNPVMRYLGRISYGVFLWQFVVIVGWYELTGQESFSGGLLSTLAVCTALTVLLADLSHRLVEAPALRLHRLRRRPARD